MDTRYMQLVQRRDEAAERLQRLDRRRKRALAKIDSSRLELQKAAAVRAADGANAGPWPSICLESPSALPLHQRCRLAFPPHLASPHLPATGPTCDFDSRLAVAQDPLASAEMVEAAERATRQGAAAEAAAAERVGGGETSDDEGGDSLAERLRFRRDSLGSFSREAGRDVAKGAAAAASNSTVSRRWTQDLRGEVQHRGQQYISLVLTRALSREHVDAISGMSQTQLRRASLLFGNADVDGDGCLQVRADHGTSEDLG